jgi:hypothetical protein
MLPFVGGWDEELFRSVLWNRIGSQRNLPLHTQSLYIKGTPTTGTCTRSLLGIYVEVVSTFRGGTRCLFDARLAARHGHGTIFQWFRLRNKSGGDLIGAV